MNKTFKLLLTVLGTILFQSSLFAQDSTATATAAPAAGVSNTALLVTLASLGVILLFVILVLNSTIKGIGSHKSFWLIKNKENLTKAILLLISLGLAPAVFGQQMASGGTVPDFPLKGFSNTFWILAFADILLFVIILVQLGVIRTLIGPLETKKSLAADTVSEAVKVKKKKTALSRLWKKMNDAVPLEREDEVMTDHVYDGIRELDNNLPPWWIYGFYVSILFAIGYFMYYQVLHLGPNQKEEYQQEMAQAKKQVASYIASQKNRVDENNVVRLTDAQDLAAGKAIFLKNCTPCHGQNGEGGVGPTFADDYWIHGGGIHNIFKSIKYGWPEKGMISWKAQLSPVQMQDVASYVMTFEGTHPANQKAPQGDLWKPAGGASAASDSTNTSVSDSTQVTKTDSTKQVASN